LLLSEQFLFTHKQGQAKAAPFLKIQNPARDFLKRNKSFFEIILSAFRGGLIQAVRI